jgi:hypothetical protein
MTTKKDNHLLRIKELGEGVELSVGVPNDGMQNASGDLPKRDYNYGPSINKAALGTKINQLSTGGGDVGVSLGVVPQRASEYPFNQVNETESGHIVEYDDTPGAERILIKHRKGAGVEVRADGSVIISATNNKVEVTGGNQKVIVEGHGDLIYNGNLNLKVSGDFNVDVGGNYNVNVGGNKVEEIQQNHKTVVTENSQYITKGTKTDKTLETHTSIMLADHNVFVDGNQDTLVEGNLNLVSDDAIFVSAKESFAASSKNTNISGAKFVSVLGQKGAIGGKKVDFTGNVYQGNEGATAEASGAIFHGTFKGIADEALRSYSANTARVATSQNYAENATGSPSGDEATKTQATITGENPITPPVVVSHTTTGKFAIQNVVIDAGDVLKDELNLLNKYFVFNKVPTTQEIRSKFRDEYNRENSGAAAVLVAEGLLSESYNVPTPTEIGRVSGKKARPQFGYEPIGNAFENRGKRFQP